MESFKLYKVDNGVNWYRCTNCGYLTRGKPSVCPLCEGKPKISDQDTPKDDNADKVIDAALQRIKAVMEKYGGDV